jgi:hypothetical protein
MQLGVLPLNHITASDPVSAATLCCLPCSLLRHPPRQVEEFELPSPKTVCFFVLLSYFFVTAGIAYDIINEPPAIGARQDPVTGDRGRQGQPCWCADGVGLSKRWVLLRRAQPQPRLGPNQARKAVDRVDYSGLHMQFVLNCKFSLVTSGSCLHSVTLVCVGCRQGQAGGVHGTPHERAVHPGGHLRGHDVHTGR